ncbi:alpha/beta fold hydrolase [Lichenibacterium ramalinae]|uniref:Alpha/beta fold hydrolase n=1 Tax=Lichenibacterium ramalinae TaxID=2316527 RepID=A0A4Q2RF63_9HYPH|nr:alpha/beta fold hydrolase [Lichenibacterium ramalinae]RYB05324.1 alpha/beta fold hydrolase [Lichenibacterium ramalinae]
MDEIFAKGTVSVSITGAGPPLWLFHSLLADRDSFAAVRAPLAERFAVHLPELPGFGASPPVPGGLAAVADRMAEAVRDRGGEAPTVLGNGYGGFVALQMAIRHPGLLRRLVLADCGACFSEPGRQAFRAMGAGVTAGGTAKIADVAMRRLFAPDFQEAHPDLMAERRAAFLRTDPAVLVAACQALADLDLRGEVPQVRVPTLVLVGERDEATPPPMSRELAALLPDARLVVLDGCAHVPQLQDPDRFLEAVGDFLDGRR